jgi:hypothetical protein
VDDEELNEADAAVQLKYFNELRTVSPSNILALNLIPNQR